MRDKLYLFIGSRERPGNGAKPYPSSHACLFQHLEIPGNHSLAPREFNCEASPATSLPKSSTTSAAVSIILPGVSIPVLYLTSLGTSLKPQNRNA